MTFDNKRTSYRIYLRKFLVTIIFTLSAIVLFFFVKFEDPWLGLNQNQWLLCLPITYLVIIAVNIYRDMNYFYFSNSGLKLIVRYYPLRPLSSNRKSIEIPKSRFAGYEIRDQAMGIKKILILKQYHKKSVVSYPPISITSLTGTEVGQLNRELAACKIHAQAPQG